MGFERPPGVWGEILLQVVTDLRLDVLTCKSCHDEYPQLRHEMGCEFLTQHEPSAVGASLDRALAQAKYLRHLRDHDALIEGPTSLWTMREHFLPTAESLIRTGERSLVDRLVKENR